MDMRIGLKLKAMIIVINKINMKIASLMIGFWGLPMDLQTNNNFLQVQIY